MFVGITRAQQELQLSIALYRDFRGRRKLTIPSHFLLELPRDEMELVSAGTSESYLSEPALPPPAAAQPEAPSRRPAAPAVHLTTAAELANGGQPSPAVSPDVFHQGMLVRHPKYGLGHVIAASGSGSGRKATVDFGTHGGRRKFRLADSPLRPVKS